MEGTQEQGRNYFAINFVTYFHECEKRLKEKEQGNSQASRQTGNIWGVVGGSVRLGSAYIQTHIKCTSAQHNGNLNCLRKCHQKGFLLTFARKIRANKNT